MQIERHAVRACDANMAHVPRMIFQCRDTEIVVACLHSQCRTHAFAGPFGFRLSVGIWCCKFLYKKNAIRKRLTKQETAKKGTRRIHIIYQAPRQCRMRVCQTYGIDEKSKAARVDEKDNDNRTPLHYAV
jgi:hypothetical protein